MTEHTHDDPERLTTSCDACIQRVKGDQREADRWGDPPVRQFEIDITFDVISHCRDVFDLEAPADMTLAELRERFADLIFDEVFVAEFVTATITRVRAVES